MCIHDLALALFTFVTFVALAAVSLAARASMFVTVATNLTLVAAVLRTYM